MAYLAARGESTFTELKLVLEVTDGNLEAHIKKLNLAGYLKTRKQREKGRWQTLYLLSSKGVKALRDYVQSLQSLFPAQDEESSQATNGIPSLHLHKI